MKKIPLTQGNFALVDDEDYISLCRYKWQFNGGYASRAPRKHECFNGKKFPLLMHRLILNPPKGFQVDHRNQNKLDNRRCNLRVATLTQNNHNVGIRRNNTSGFKGVSFDKERGKYRANIDHGRQIFLGRFDTPEEAHAAYAAKAREFRGEFVCV